MMYDQWKTPALKRWKCIHFHRFKPCLSPRPSFYTVESKNGFDVTWKKASPCILLKGKDSRAEPFSRAAQGPLAVGSGNSKITQIKKVRDETARISWTRNVTAIVWSRSFLGGHHRGQVIQGIPNMWYFYRTVSNDEIIKFQRASLIDSVTGLSNPRTPAIPLESFFSLCLVQ